MKYRPVRNHCIVRIKSEEVTTGGIVIPTAQREKHDMAKEEGEVVSKGPDFFCDSDDKEQVRVGDTVFFARYAGKQLITKDEDGYEIRVMPDISIIAVKEV